jgi:hypothetical protein
MEELENYLDELKNAEDWFEEQQITRYKLNEFILKLLVDYAKYYHKQKMINKYEYAIESKLVTLDLDTCRKLIDKFKEDGYLSDDIIQDNDEVYWTILTKNFTKESSIEAQK